MAHTILYYEKARKLDPNNPDILHNLRIANSRIPDRIEDVPEIFLIRWWNTFYDLFSVNTWAKIGIGLFILFVLMGGLYFTGRGRKLRKFAFWTGLTVLALTTFSLGLAAQKYHYSKKVNEAIVFSPSVTVKSAPNKTSVDLFVVHEGTRVKITDQAGEWYEIEIANGSIGWLPQSAVENI
ncbi:MAG: SH3 domain-containing protein [Bacteroidales bacterium]|nr:SH3 domain-containing protein [Bacteroidales bacterium]MCF8344055.1 SH3 domain-containing protein [Bacteroidales bacterium]MCF8351145.1 SH3 domain-containing protein [Bacteroidales bacterium]MCF8376610.1 SH3 domain-containing protein [Bacteroidales bacterium]MCF8400668.1 SH3 domain-containing protein [Bacteroidales bacterium]